jgi:hypothetical protein
MKRTAYYRPGIYLVIAGLAAQCVDLIVTQRFKIDMRLQMIISPINWKDKIGVPPFN